MNLFFKYSLAKIGKTVNEYEYNSNTKTCSYTEEEERGVEKRKTT
jgi:hypothetical protein